jgi:hypothetical protein
LPRSELADEIVAAYPALAALVAERDSDLGVLSLLEQFRGPSSHEPPDA